MSFDAFISYPHQDKPTADAACAALEGSGIRCWIAPRDIVPGRDWGESIIDAIENAKVMVLIFSGHANASPQIKREVERAVNKGIPIIPVRIENVIPSKSLEYFISTPHWLDAFTPPLERHLKQLAAAVKALILIDPDGMPLPPPPEALAQPPAATLSDIRRMFLTAQTQFDLNRARHAIEAFLRREPDNIDALQLHDQISAAIERERLTSAPAEAGPRYSLPPRPSFRLPAIAAVLVALLIIPAALFLAYPSFRSQSPLIRTLTGHTDKADSVSFTPDGKWIAASGWDGTIKIWTTADGKLVRTIIGIDGGGAPFSPDGKLIASGGRADVKIWDAATGRLVQRLLGPEGKVLSVAFSPNGSTLASGGLDKTVRTWDLGTGGLRADLRGHTDAVWSVAFSPDGRTIASASFDGTVRLWDVATGRALQSLTGHSSRVAAVAFSPDGRWLASGGEDGTVKVWDASNGQPVRAFTGHSGLVARVAFSPDSKSIASASFDATVKIWDTDTGQLVSTLSGHQGPVYAVTFSPDGKLLASAGDDRTVKIWKAP